MFPTLVLAVLQVADPLAVVVDQIRPDQDVLAYHIAVDLPDTGTEIRGATTVRYAVTGGRGPLVLDFDAVFKIDSIVWDGGRATEQVRDGTLRVRHWGAPGDTLALTVFYHGSPTDGLFIQENVHGQRTAFADNWPNRARHWFPSEDHPSDKAFASFAVQAPAGWKVVANGNLESVDLLPSGRSRWHWRTERPIPVYTMVIGAGPLTVTPVGSWGTPQSLWSFAPDSAFAVNGPFRRVARMVAVYDSLLGPFPYAKLAHVQSSTRFGGMENSGAIFYTENGYARRSMREGLVAHETAHQWFGDAVTEYDWHHLWLSEGFASYFDPVFFQMVGEEDAFRQAMAGKRSAYMDSDDVHRPVIDTTVTDLFALLNRNNYQKGAWILHMLRGEMGDAAFFDGIREYYRTFRDSTTVSSDLLAVMERHLGRPLRWFFEQWLTQPGFPQIDVDIQHEATRGSAVVRLTQVQDEAWGSYRLSVPIRIRLVDGTSRWAQAEFLAGSREAAVTVSEVGDGPLDVTVDPNDDLLIAVMSRSGR